MRRTPVSARPQFRIGLLQRLMSVGRSSRTHGPVYAERRRGKVICRGPPAAPAVSTRLESGPTGADRGAARRRDALSRAYFAARRGEFPKRARERAIAKPNRADFRPSDTAPPFLQAPRPEVLGAPRVHERRRRARGRRRSGAVVSARRRAGLCHGAEQPRSHVPDRRRRATGRRRSGAVAPPEPTSCSERATRPTAQRCHSGTRNRVSAQIRPSLVRPRGHQLGLGVLGMVTLIAPLSDRLIRGQDPIHRPRRAQVLAFVEQRRHDLCRRTVDEAWAGEHIEDVLALGLAPGRALDGATGACESASDDGRRLPATPPALGTPAPRRPALQAVGLPSAARSVFEVQSQQPGNFPLYVQVSCAR